VHEEIAAAHPELAPFLVWHCVNMVTGPMHYYGGNAEYWAGYSGWCKGETNDPPNFEHLKSTICWGVLPGETDEKLRPYMCATPEAVRSDPHKFEEKLVDLRSLLRERFLPLMDAFDVAMVALFGASIIPEVAKYREMRHATYAPTVVRP
jgi:hypothetical protein